MSCLRLGAGAALEKDPGLPRVCAGCRNDIITAALICAPWELYTIAAYGLDAKIHANPSVSQRLQNMPAWLNAFLVGVSTLCAWGPVVMLRHWLTVEAPLAPARIQREIYWLVTSCFNSLAGSLAGILVPWLAALRFKQLSACLLDLWTKTPMSYRFALALSLAGQILLNPFYGTDGMPAANRMVPCGGADLRFDGLDFTPAADRAKHGQLNHDLLPGLVPWAAFHLMLTGRIDVQHQAEGTTRRIRRRFAENHQRPVNAAWPGRFPMGSDHRPRWTGNVIQKRRRV